MMNVRNLWKGIVLSVGFSALLPTVVGCDASESLEVTSTAQSSTQNHRLVVRFSPLKHGPNESIGQDGSEQEDYVMKLYAMGGGRILGNPDVLAATGVPGRAEWESSNPPSSSPSPWAFIANLDDSDVERVKDAGGVSGVDMETAKYLRGYGNVSIAQPPLMVAVVPNSKFDGSGRTRTFSTKVQLKRVLARFSFQTFPLPKGYTIKKVTIERVPNRFNLYGHYTSGYYKDLVAREPSKYGFLPKGSYVIWDRSTNEAHVGRYARWEKSPWDKSGDQQADMYMRGKFYMPSLRSNWPNDDVFGSNGHWDMAFMRFVFTDKQGRTFVRLYRLGNSTANKAGRGNIDSNNEYDIRINLLGTYFTRRDNDEVLIQYDEGDAKAAYVN